MTYKLYAVRIFSTDWETSTRFYEETIGFPLAFKDEKMGWAQFKLGGAYLGVERCDPNDTEATSLVGRFAGTSIQVDDIHVTYEQLRAKGVKFTSPPERQPWGGVLANFEDPDGNTITLIGNVV